MQIDYSGFYDDIKYDDLLMLSGYTTSHKFLQIRHFIYITGFFLLTFAAINFTFLSNKSSVLSSLFVFLGVVCLLIAGILSILDVVQRKKKIGIKGKITGQISEIGNTMWINDKKISVDWDKYEGYRLTPKLILLVRKDDIKAENTAQMTLQINSRMFSVIWKNRDERISREDLISLTTKNKAQLITRAFFASDDDWSATTSFVESKLKEISISKPSWKHWLFIIFLMVASAMAAIYAMLKNYAH